jgi:hypothetical protein
MRRRASILIAVVCLLAATASAQDARSVLQASAKAMGLSNLKTIQYSGAGWFSLIGQTYGLNEHWLMLKLDVAQHVPIHGRVATNEEFLKLVGGKTLSSEK